MSVLFANADQQKNAGCGKNAIHGDPEEGVVPAGVVVYMHDEDHKAGKRSRGRRSGRSALGVCQFGEGGEWWSKTGNTPSFEGGR